MSDTNYYTVNTSRETAFYGYPLHQVEQIKAGYRCKICDKYADEKEGLYLPEDDIVVAR